MCGCSPSRGRPLERSGLYCAVRMACGCAGGEHLRGERWRAMRRSLIALAVGVLTIATSGITLAGPDKNSQELFPNERRILSNSQKAFSGGTKAGSALNMAVV